MKCPRMSGCPVFPEFRTQAALKTMQALYCEGDYQRCERFKSVSDGVVPPRNLLPDGTTLRNPRSDQG